jgi:hypothetical protein
VLRPAPSGVVRIPGSPITSAAFIAPLTPTVNINIMASSIPSTSSLEFSTRLQPYPRPQNRFLETDTKAISYRVLAEGAEHVVSHGGTGQYGGDGAGVSACGLAALNFARVVFSIEQGGLKDEALLQAVLARECIEVRASYNPLPEHSLISPGNNRDMRIVVR